MEAGKDFAFVAGFEPFGGRRRNRSWEVVRRLDLPPGVRRVRLPVDFVRLRETIQGLVAEEPRALLLVGEMATGPIRVEGIALNVIHSALPDNAGRTEADASVVPGASLARRARWNPARVVETFRAAGISSTVSFHAGTYACNAALYLALHLLPRKTGVGFLHIPRRGGPAEFRLPELVRATGLALSTLIS